MSRAPRHRRDIVSMANLTHWLISTQAENGDGLTPAEVAYIELQNESSKDAGALQRCHELLA